VQTTTYRSCVVSSTTRTSRTRSWLKGAESAGFLVERIVDRRDLERAAATRPTWRQGGDLVLRDLRFAHELATSRNVALSRHGEQAQSSVS
jgi:hypothetical protein